MSEEDGVRLAEEVDTLQHDLFNGGLSSNHLVSDAMHLLDVRRKGYLRVYELLEGGKRTAPTLTSPYAHIYEGSAPSSGLLYRLPSR